MLVLENLNKCDRKMTRKWLEIRLKNTRKLTKKRVIKDEEIERLEKEEARLKGELARVNGVLNNERFMSKAPEAKVAEERAKLEKYTQMQQQVQERLAQLKK